jgi:cob(I)alamin adenosyltransferase
MTSQEIAQRQTVLLHEQRVNDAFNNFELWPSPSARARLAEARKWLRKSKRELSRLLKEAKATKNA